MFVEFYRNIAKFVEICIVLAKNLAVLCRFIAKNAVVFRQIIFLTSRKILHFHVVELSKDVCQKMKLINVEKYD